MQVPASGEAGGTGGELEMEGFGAGGGGGGVGGGGGDKDGRMKEIIAVVVCVNAREGKVKTAQAQALDSGSL